MKIAYVAYPDFTGLDLIGPYEVISRWPDVDVRFVATSSGSLLVWNNTVERSTSGRNSLRAEHGHSPTQSHPRRLAPRRPQR